MALPLQRHFAPEHYQSTYYGVTFRVTRRMVKVGGHKVQKFRFKRKFVDLLKTMISTRWHDTVQIYIQHIQATRYRSLMLKAASLPRAQPQPRTGSRVHRWLVVH